MQPRAGGDAQELAAEDPDLRRAFQRASFTRRRIRRFCMECCCMTSAAEHRRRVPTDGKAILNPLPNPVLLTAPDGPTLEPNIPAQPLFPYPSPLPPLPPPTPL